MNAHEQPITNADALEHMLRANRRASLVLLEAAADIIPQVDDRHSKVRLQTEAEVAEALTGIIVGTSRVGSEHMSVVLTEDRQVWVGRLIVRHDAKAESTVIASAASMTLDELETALALEVDRTVGNSEAIMQVLSRPDALEQHLDRLFDLAPHR